MPKCKHDWVTVQRYDDGSVLQACAICGATRVIDSESDSSETWKVDEE